MVRFKSPQTAERLGAKPMTMISLSDLTAQRLRNVAHSAGVDLEGETKKDAIIEKLAEEEVRLTEEGWKHGDESFELQEQVSKPSDENILYGFRRSAASDEIMEEIQELFDDTRFEMRLLEKTATDKEPVKIVIPADEPEE